LELNEPKRLFFALWPEPALQQAFFDTGKTLFNLCGGRRTRRENIHLTLAFLGAVEADRVNRVIAVADQLQAPCFDLLFDRLGWWRQNQVAWASCSEVPRALSTLVKTLQSALMQEGFKFDDRRFVPHVTLLRKAQCRASVLESASIFWSVQQFVLVSSTLHQGGPHYTIVKRWSLAD
jgi:RNA 2',3'-cyclic 3'-phosphodiesterase